MTKLLLPFLLLILTPIVFSQITQGEIIYNMEMYDENNEAGGAVQILGRSKMTLQFSNQNTRTSVKMGDDMEMTTILNKTDETGLLIMKGLMGDIAITASYDQITEGEDEGELEIHFFDKTKEIHGYVCKKAKVNYPNGAIATYWYTDDIQFSKKGIENMHITLPGTPLEYKIESDSSIMTFKAQSVKEMDDASITNLFSTLPPVGFKSITYKEFEENGF